MTPSPSNSRRWPRNQVDLQVYVLLRDGESIVVVPGRLTELSEGGMALYAGINLQPGDLLEVEFPTRQARALGRIRNREGYCFGVEFVTSLSTPAQPASRTLALFQQRHEVYLRQNEDEISRLQKEVAALRRAALMADEIKKL
jgi:hypothetical protein